MRPFLRYLFLFFIMIIITQLMVPGWFELHFPRQPGPEFDARVRKIYTDLLNTNQSEIVLVGDSTLMLGVNPELLSERLQKKIESISMPGSASALWYLVIKNNLVVAKHRPDAIVIIFRDTILTAPGYRVNGGYFAQLDEFASKQEPVLLERAFLDQMNPVEKWGEEYFPLYSAREQIRNMIDSWIRYTLPGWLNCNRKCTDDSMYAVFTSIDLEPGQLRKAVATAEQYLYTPDQLDFKKQVNNSFLPEMIRLTKERGIQLIVVRLKSQTMGSGNSETSAVRSYIADLRQFLGQQDVLFLDYGRDPRLTTKYYFDDLHLNKDGKILFTAMLSEGLNKLLK